MMGDINERSDDITIEEEAMEQEVRPRLQIGHTVPEFRLRTAAGQVIQASDYKQRRNLVLFFFDIHESEDWEMLAALKQRYGEFLSENAEILAISSGPAEELRDCMDSMQLPFNLLCDCARETTCTYCVVQTTLFVADKFGELKMQSEVNSENIDEVIDQAISTLDLSELECPECGVSTWPKF